MIVITTLFLILKQKKEKISKVEILERQRNSVGPDALLDEIIENIESALASFKTIKENLD